MKKLLARIEVINYYFLKIENYLKKKHQNLISRASTDSIYSGSPRSTLSDRVQSEDEKIEEEEDYVGGEESGNFDRKANKAVASTCSSSKVEDINMEGLPKGLKVKNLLDLEEDNFLFKDFTEPDLMKTGYLIPLKCGHNGQLSMNEKNIYEIHLTSAGFIREADHHNSSDIEES